MTVVVVAVADAETTSNCYSHNNERDDVNVIPFLYIYLVAIDALENLSG